MEQLNAKDPGAQQLIQQVQHPVPIQQYPQHYAMPGPSITPTMYHEYYSNPAWTPAPPMYQQTRYEHHIAPIPSSLHSPPPEQPIPGTSKTQPESYDTYIDVEGTDDQDEPGANDTNKNVPKNKDQKEKQKLKIKNPGRKPNSNRGRKKGPAPCRRIGQAMQDQHESDRIPPSADVATSYYQWNSNNLTKSFEDMKMPTLCTDQFIVDNVTLNMEAVHEVLETMEHCNQKLTCPYCARPIGILPEATFNLHRNHCRSLYIGKLGGVLTCPQYKNQPIVQGRVLCRYNANHHILPHRQKLHEELCKLSLNNRKQEQQQQYDIDKFPGDVIQVIQRIPLREYLRAKYQISDKDDCLFPPQFEDVSVKFYSGTIRV